MTCRFVSVCALLLVSALLAGCAQAGVEVDRAAAEHQASRASAQTHQRPADAPSAADGATPSSADGGPAAASAPSSGAVLGELDAAPKTTATGQGDVTAFESGRVTPVTVHFVRRWAGRLYLVPEKRQTGSGVDAVESAARLALTEQPTWAGSVNPFPPGTELLGLALLDGTATLDLSSDVLAWQGTAEDAWYSVQALTRTLASTGRVDRVRVRVEGRSTGRLAGHDVAELWTGIGLDKPVQPDPSARLAPIILAQPRPGSAVTDGRLLIQGEASTGQGTVSLRLRDADGQVVAQNFTTAEEKAPKRGAFSVALPFTPPRRPAVWTLEVFEADPAGGTITYQVTVPVQVGG
jgi:hypothetical protein